jgi:hypothetical protein
MEEACNADGGTKEAYKSLLRKPEGKRTWETCYDRILLKRILIKWELRVWTGFVWLKMWSGGGLV